MFDPRFLLFRFSAGCALVCVSALAHARTAIDSAGVVVTNHVNISAHLTALSTGPFVGDDPVAIRDALAERRINANIPSLTERIQRFIHVPARKAPLDAELAKSKLDRKLAFVAPVSHGILYRSKTHTLTVNVDLSDDDAPGVILIRKAVTGSSGRGLVVAAEAKSRGYIQHIDQIQLNSGEVKKSTVRGHIMLSQKRFSDMNDHFAIVLMCTLAAPYLSDRRDHIDASNEEPTDITTRSSTLYVKIDAIWLVNPQTGVVLSKGLHLSE